MTKQKWYLRPVVLGCGFLVFAEIAGEIRDHRRQREHDEAKERIQKEFEIREIEWKNGCQAWVRETLPLALTGKVDAPIAREYLKFCEGRKVEVTNILPGFYDEHRNLTFFGELVADGQKFEFKVILDSWVNYPEQKAIQDLFIYR